MAVKLKVSREEIEKDFEAIKPKRKEDQYIWKMFGLVLEVALDNRDRMDQIVRSLGGR